MLHGQLRLDLPSAEMLRKQTLWGKLKAALGADPVKGRGLGLERISADSWTLLSGVVEGLRAAGVDDVICFAVDNQLLYKDLEHQRADLPQVLQSARAQGLAEAEAEEMHLVLGHSELGLDFLFDLRVRCEVPLSEEELVITASARPKALRPQPGEGPAAYVERAWTWLRDTPPDLLLESFRERLERVGDSLADLLEGAVTRFAATIQLTRPNIADVQRFADLPFGQDVERTWFRFEYPPPQPGFDDLFWYYYPDRYYYLTSYLVIEALFEGVWCEPFVHIIRPTGELLFGGDEVDEEHPLRELSGFIEFAEGSIGIDPALTEQVPTLEVKGVGRNDPHPLHEAIFGPVGLRRRSYVRGGTDEHFSNIDGAVQLRKG